MSEMLRGFVWEKVAVEQGKCQVLNLRVGRSRDQPIGIQSNSNHSLQAMHEFSEQPGDMCQS